MPRRPRNGYTPRMDSGRLPSRRTERAVRLAALAVFFGVVALYLWLHRPLLAGLKTLL